MTYDPTKTIEQTLATFAAQLAVLEAKAATPTPTPSPTLTALLLSSTSLKVGVPFVASVAGATSGSTVTATGLPAGLTLTNRTVSGTPTTAGNASLILTEVLAGAVGSPRSSTIAMTVDAAAPVLGAITVSNTAAQVGVAFSATVSGATAGSLLVASALPAGLTLNSAERTVTGTPTASGNAAVTITVNRAGFTGGIGL